MSEAVEYLKRYQAWRTGEDDRTMDEAGISPAELTAAINTAIEELERWQSVSRLQDVALDNANGRAGELTAQNAFLTRENAYLRREMIPPDAFTRLIEWLRADQIKPACQSFTAGFVQQMAYALEDEVVPLIKYARMVKRTISQTPSNAMIDVKLNSDAAHWKANHDAQVERARVLIDRIDMPFQRVKAYNDYTRFKTGYDRYEALRKLNVHQFAELFKRNLAGGPVGIVAAMWAHPKIKSWWAR